jgi:hypothetical protein
MGGLNRNQQASVSHPPVSPLINILRFEVLMRQSPVPRGLGFNGEPQLFDCIPVEEQHIKAAKQGRLQQRKCKAEGNDQYGGKS